MPQLPAPVPTPGRIPGRGRRRVEHPGTGSAGAAGGAAGGALADDAQPVGPARAVDAESAVGLDGRLDTLDPVGAQLVRERPPHW